MDIDELQTVQSRERQTDSLQQLRDSFYSEASEYIQQLREARDQAAQRADDPWDNPEVNRLSDEIKTSEQTVEAIYDRRVGKVVKKASLAAADMPADEDGLTTEERALFEQLVESIEDNRGHVLDMVAGDAEPAASPVDSSETTRASADTAPEPAQQSTTERQPSDVVSSQQPDAAGGQQSSSEAPVAEADSSAPPKSSGDDVPAADVMNTDGGTRTVPPESETTTPMDGGPEASSRVKRQTVKITEDVGEIFGVDEREYDLSTEDVVTLPADNAEPLVEQDAAMRLD